MYVCKNLQVLGNDDKISSFGGAFLPIILLPARACQANSLQEKSSLWPDSLCYLLLQQRLKLNDAAWALRSWCSPNCQSEMAENNHGCTMEKWDGYKVPAPLESLLPLRKV